MITARAEAQDCFIRQIFKISFIEIAVNLQPTKNEADTEDHQGGPQLMKRRQQLL